MSLVHQASCVAIGGRAVLIEGPPGSGKSSLALALIDRGAVLVGDDAVTLTAEDGHLVASPPPNIAGLIEVRNLGLLSFPTMAGAPVALVLRLDQAAPRFIDAPERTSLCGVSIPSVALWPNSEMLALKAELALQQYGLGADPAIAE
jgi:serine kinase of HPr protein (carbohydrate metabolism regulator)